MNCVDTILPNTLWKGFGADVISLDPKKFSTIKQVISFATDKKSLENSFQVIENLNKCIETLPIKDADLSEEKLNVIMTITTQNLLQTNKALGFIDEVFNIEEGIETEIIIDDKMAKNLFCNIQAIKGKLEYISDYINLVFKVAKAKSALQSKTKGMDIDTFLAKLNAA